MIRLMVRSLPIFFSALFMPGVSANEAGEELILDEELVEQQSGNGVVIELDHAAVVEPKPVSKRKAGPRRVEMIVGGQGDQGVAKRNTLKVED